MRSMRTAARSRSSCRDGGDSPGLRGGGHEHLWRRSVRRNFGSPPAARADVNAADAAGTAHDSKMHEAPTAAAENASPPVVAAALLHPVTTTTTQAVAAPTPTITPTTQAVLPAPAPPAVTPAADPAIATLVAQVEASGIDPGSNWSWSMGDTATHCAAMSGGGTGCTYGTGGQEFTIFAGSPNLALVAHELANAETQNDAVPTLMNEVATAEDGTSWSPTDAVASCLVETLHGVPGRRGRNLAVLGGIGCRSGREHPRRKLNLRPNPSSMWR